MFKRVFPRSKGLGLDTLQEWLENGGETTLEEFVSQYLESKGGALRLEFSGRSISKGFLSPNVMGYSPKTMGTTLKKACTIKRIIYQTTTPVNKVINIRTTDGDILYSFVADSNKEIEPESIFIDPDKTVNIFVDGPDHMISLMKLDLELEVQDS